MTTSVPPPLPKARQSCGSRFPAFVAGLIFGAAVVGVAATAFIRGERARSQAARAETQAMMAQVGAALPRAGQIFNGVLDSEFPPGGITPATAQPDAGKIKSLGDETVDDLRQGRLLAVYRLTTKDYQAGKKREDFEKMIAEVQHVAGIQSFAQNRESKVRKAADGDGYEYYCSAPGPGFVGNVNFAFTFIPGDNGVWRISQLDVNYANR